MLFDILNKNKPVEETQKTTLDDVVKKLDELTKVFAPQLSDEENIDNIDDNEDEESEE